MLLILVETLSEGLLIWSRSPNLTLVLSETTLLQTDTLNFCIFLPPTKIVLETSNLSLAYPASASHTFIT